MQSLLTCKICNIQCSNSSMKYKLKDGTCFLKIDDFMATMIFFSDSGFNFEYLWIESNLLNVQVSHAI